MRLDSINISNYSITGTPLCNVTSQKKADEGLGSTLALVLLVDSVQDHDERRDECVVDIRVHRHHEFVLPEQDTLDGVLLVHLQYQMKQVMLETPISSSRLDLANPSLRVYLAG